MPYSEIMVHVDPESDSADRVSIAVDLAKRAKASLIGIGGWVPGMGFAVDVAVIDEEPVKHQTEELVTLMARAEQRFFNASKDVESVEWRGELRRPLDYLTREARSAGLVIIGARSTTVAHCEPLDPGAAILRMGRPVLAVPSGVGKLSARRIVIAWKDCREARRAVRDALPLLQSADEVMVVEVEETAVREAAERVLEDVAGYLLHHSVPVKAKVFLRREGTVASELIAFAQREKSDLLVAGAYGHSRLGEWMFGGVTRELLERSPVCCLFAH
jgi:nucleotide-binding universal stress UspA family protein